MYIPLSVENEQYIPSHSGTILNSLFTLYLKLFDVLGYIKWVIPPTDKVICCIGS